MSVGDESDEQIEIRKPGASENSFCFSHRNTIEEKSFFLVVRASQEGVLAFSCLLFTFSTRNITHPLLRIAPHATNLISTGENGLLGII